MKKRFISLLCVVTMFGMLSPITLAEDSPTIIFVALDGNDSNSGTEKEPLATLTAARDMIRELKNQNKLASGGAVVYIREGEYSFQEGLKLTKEDSGTKEAPIVYRNYPGEEVKFVGGANIPVDKFTKVTDESVLERIVDKNARSRIVCVDMFALGYTSLPELPWPGSYSYYKPMPQITGKTSPEAWAPELIIDGTAMTVARYPNEDYLYIESVIEPGAETRFWNYDETSENYVKPEDRIPTPFTITVDDNRVAKWSDAKDALMYGSFKFSWASQTVPLASVNASNNSITSKYPSLYSVIPKQYFYVYNLLEEIDIPGEYFVDRNEGKLYLYPPVNGLNNVMYTTLDTYMFDLLETSYVTIKGIDMSYMRCGAVKMKDTTGCEVEDCEISYSSKIAISVNGIENKVYDCYLHDVAGGIGVSGGDFETLTKSMNVIENNEIERADRLSKTYSPGITFEGVGHYILHNKLHEADHDLMQFSGNEHTIAYNEIYDGCLHTDDMGAVYAGRDLTNRGNQIIHNYIHDIGDKSAGTQGVQGVFLDDFWSAALIKGNVFENITGGAVKFAGSYNEVSNNLFINCEKTAGLLNRSFTYGNSDYISQLVDPLKEKPYIYNDIWLEKYPTIANVVDENGNPDVNSHITARNNVLYNTPAFKISSEIAETVTTENNIEYKSDPGFYDIEGKNYLLNKDSDVYGKIPDFEPILFTRMGKYSNRAVARAKKAYILCCGSPYIMKKGEVFKNNVPAMKNINGKFYIPIRTAIETVDGELEFDETTKIITLSAQNKMVIFKDGAKDKVTLNGDSYNLKDPIVNIDFANYISTTDLAEIFDKEIIEKNELAIISDYEDLFINDLDDGLLRYIKEQITVY